MPSDEALEQLGANVAVGVWINVSLLLSTLVPILGILYLDSLIFWVVSVIVAAAKALHSLEEQRMKTEPKSSQLYRTPMHSSHFQRLSS